jgi:predicted DNA-binding protein (MmcQ/YjbR family)
MADAQVEVPREIFELVSALCGSLPEVSVRVDLSGTTTRSTAHSFDIRKRSFCLLVAREGAAGTPRPMLVLRVDSDEREALLASGHPFVTARDRHDRITVLLDERTDWAEVRALVIESYRMIAPKKLSALIV